VSETAPPAGSVRASLAWSYGAHLLVFAVTFGGMALVSRLLSARELGIFGVGFAISGLLSAVSLFGVANFLIRERELSPQIVATCFTVNAIVSLAIAALLLLLGSAGAPLFAEPAIAEVLQVLALTPVVALFEMVPAALMTRAMRFGPLSIIQLGKATANAGAMIASAYAGWSYVSPAIGAVAGAAFGALAFSMVGRRDVCLRLSLKGARAVAAFTLHMMAAGGIPIMGVRVAELFVAQLLGLAALGIYTRASQLAAIIWDGVYGLSIKVIFVQMAAELRATGTVKNTFLRATRLISAVMWPAMAGIAVLAGPIVHHIYGPQWHAAALPLTILMAAQIISIAFAMSWELCVLSGRTAWQAQVEAARALAGLVATAAGALVSLPLAAAGRIVDALVSYAFYRPRLLEIAGATPAETRQAYSGNVLLALVAVAPAAGLMTVRGWAYGVPIAELSAAIAAGIVLWLAMLRATNHSLYTEVDALFRRR
jgi:O-antigen/teichoic acid export membrane protein